MGQTRQMEKHVRLVVAQGTDRILTVVLIAESAGGQGGKSIQIEDFFKIAYTICWQIQIFQIY